MCPSLKTTLKVLKSEILYIKDYFTVFPLKCITVKLDYWFPFFFLKDSLQDAKKIAQIFCCLFWIYPQFANSWKVVQIFCCLFRIYSKFGNSWKIAQIFCCLFWIYSQFANSWKVAQFSRTCWLRAAAAASIWSKLKLRPSTKYISKAVGLTGKVKSCK